MIWRACFREFLLHIRAGQGSRGFYSPSRRRVCVDQDCWWCRSPFDCWTSYKLCQSPQSLVLNQIIKNFISISETYRTRSRKRPGLFSILAKPSAFARASTVHTVNRSNFEEASFKPIMIWCSSWGVNFWAHSRFSCSVSGTALRPSLSYNNNTHQSCHLATKALGSL